MFQVVIFLYIIVQLEDCSQTAMLTTATQNSYTLTDFKSSTVLDTYQQMPCLVAIVDCTHVKKISTYCIILLLPPSRTL